MSATGVLSCSTEQSRWHATEIDRALHILDTSREGLTADEAERRLLKEGPNRLPERKRPSALVRLFRQFHSVLIYALLVSALISLLLDHPLDAAVILAVVLLNAIVGFVQEGRADNALAAIQGMIEPHCTVQRDGSRISLSASELVRGDLVFLEAGDRVPADMRLLRARHLKIDESILTGESLPVDKSASAVSQDAAMSDRTSLAFSGAFVTSGQGSGVVFATGSKTELGRINELLGTIETLRTPLINQMDRFARQVTMLVLAVSGVTLAYAHLIGGYSATDAFMTVVGLAVAAIPEGLPTIMSITLAIGVQRMATRHAIIRNLPAVETLGSVAVICSDKTGTLTRNEMTARALVTADDRYAVSGIGYEPKGDIHTHEGLPAANSEELSALLYAAVLCNDASLRRMQFSWGVDGDPMEGALVALGMKAGIDVPLLRKEMRRKTEIPFDAQHRFMASLHFGDDGSSIILMKGAPERVLKMCSTERRANGIAPLNEAFWQEAANDLAKKGLRVLAFSSKPARRGQEDLSFNDISKATMLGCIGFIDPPRAEAIDAIKECQQAGIRVIMITGDHAATAYEISRQLGLAEDPKVLTGKDLDTMDQPSLLAAVRETNIFARTAPEQKLRLVQALQMDGLTVAMTGDGVNDAPALKRADVGIAMGRKGTEAAKEAAKVVLADDNFASIVAAVSEGRTVYDNLIKMISWTLPTNGGEVGIILAAIAFGLALPVTPVQILWINMITAVALGLTLAFEPTEPGTMRRLPRARHTPILSRELVWQIAFVSFLIVCGAFGIFHWSLRQGYSIESARTNVVNAIVVMDIAYLLAVRYAYGSSPSWKRILRSPAVLIGIVVVIAAQLALTYAPGMNAIFATRPSSLTEIVAVIGVGLTLLVLVEAQKRVRRALLGHQVPA